MSAGRGLRGSRKITEAGREEMKEAASFDLLKKQAP